MLLPSMEWAMHTRPSNCKVCLCPKRSRQRRRRWSFGAKRRRSHLIQYYTDTGPPGLQFQIVTLVVVGPWAFPARAASRIRSLWRQEPRALARFWRQGTAPARQRSVGPCCTPPWRGAGASKILLTPSCSCLVLSWRLELDHGWFCCELAYSCRRDPAVAGAVLL